MKRTVKILAVIGILLIGAACQTGSVQQSPTVPTVTPEVEVERVEETRAIPTAVEVMVTPDAVIPTATATLTATTEMTGAVACPFGQVNDPYPGQCKRYVDTNDNGICDLSEPGFGDAP